jgi:hypothetical protein
VCLFSIFLGVIIEVELLVHMVILCLSFFLVGLELELRALHLQNRCSTVLRHTSSPFCSGYFGDGGLLDS